MHGSDRRRAPRVSLGSVDVRLSGTRGSLIDVSVLGALVQSPVHQTPDKTVVFEMDAAGAPLAIHARVVRTISSSSGEHRVALEFAELSMDAIVLLSRLVEEDREPTGAVVVTAQPSGWWS